MSKIDTSPKAIRELVNREVSRSHDDYYSQACKMTRNEWIKAVLAMRPPVGFEDRRSELHKRITEAKTATFLDIHRKSTHKENL